VRDGVIMKRVHTLSASSLQPAQSTRAPGLEAVLSAPVLPVRLTLRFDTPASAAAAAAALLAGCGLAERLLCPEDPRAFKQQVAACRRHGCGVTYNNNNNVL
jgi:hypothetical protein